MSYSNNPYAPKARRLAVNLVTREGLSVAEAARRSGVHRTTLHRWIRKARELELHDNAHIERFNRTIQEECLSPEVRETTVADKLYWYLLYYNQFRRHSGIQGRYPLDLLNWKRC